MRINTMLGLLAVTFSSTAVAGSDFQEGQWEYELRMQFGAPGAATAAPQMPQLPDGFKLPGGMQMPSFGPQGMTTRFQKCMTKDDLVPKDDKSPQKCEITDMKRDGGTVRWKMHCSDPHGNMDGEGKAVYSGNAMTSEMKLRGTHDGERSEMNQKITGRYLGVCPDKVR